MKTIIIIFITIIMLFITTLQTSQNSQIEEKTMNYNKLSKEEQRVILYKGTEIPYSGEFYSHKEDGTYICKQCDAPLYKSTDKFDSGCGWPSFDDEIKGAIKRVPDEDGSRVEIVCANCGGHLGHVFEGEKLTPKNTRHCVNSVSIDFKSISELIDKNSKAYFAGGCFWGVEYHFEKLDGVISAVSGYMGGTTPSPNYKEICTGATGHLEVVEVTYDKSKINFETLTKLFFEIHDPSQTNGQGPDIGTQYLSAVFYSNEDEKRITKKLIDILEEKNINVATKLISTLNTPFFKAEDYHQDYYNKTGKTPYCHTYTKRF